jgi:hypothetical protein
MDEPYDAYWWIRRKLSREQISVTPESAVHLHE